MPGKKEFREEVLETLWTAEEDDKQLTTGDIEESLDLSGQDLPELLTEMESKHLISINKGRISLDRNGTEIAEKVIRRHRLAERLLKDVLEVNIESIEGPACQLEHAISPEVETKICTLLGHPNECPHGNSIPDGQCCLESQQVVSKAITSLNEVDVGKRVNIAYLTLTEEARLNRLSSLGVLPGVSVIVAQKFPAFVVELDETRVAMEKKVARNIFVRNGETTAGEHNQGSETKPDSLLNRLKRKLIPSLG